MKTGQPAGRLQKSMGQTVGLKKPASKHFSYYKSTAVRFADGPALSPV